MKPLQRFGIITWFEKCVGAIDGTHVSASAQANRRISYHGRKVLVTQNMLCTCSFGMMFTFVYTGREGTLNGSRVSLDAIVRREVKFPKPANDTGYTNMLGFLTSYRGECYHLRDYREKNRQLRGSMELFNYRHSSLRNVIERCFGVIKAWFPI